MHLIRRSAQDERGAVAILVAASLVVLGMSCALAVDLGNVAQLHRHAEYTVDNAAISGADLLQQGTDTLTQVVSATETYVDENWSNLPSSAWDTCPSIPTGFSAPSGLGENCVTFNGAATAISVEFPPQSVPFTVARLGGFTSGTVEAQATAVLVPGTSPCALCLLGPGGLTLNDTGNGSFTVTDTTGNAGIDANSSGTPSAQINSNSGSIVAPQINLHGTYSEKKPGGFQPTPLTGQGIVPDPLGSLPLPTTSSGTSPLYGGAIPTASYSCTSACGLLPANTYGNVSLGGNGTLTIQPGNYSGISVIGGGTLTLMQGIYFITGPFSVGGTGGATVNSSNGVMMYFTCNSGNQVAACAGGGQPGGSLSLSGTGTMNLAPQGGTGPYADLTVFYDRNNDAGMTLTGTPGLSLSGTIYAKDSALSISGTGSTIESLIIVSSASINGNGTIGVNYDASQNVRPPGAPYLCSVSANNC
jgi:hypothetical protein